MARTWVGVVAAASMVMVGSALPAGAAVSPGDVRVSGPSPYAGCSTPTHGPFVVYPQAEVEPQVTSNPANPRNLVGAWQQDRWGNGASHGLVAGYSFDGGASWGETTLPFSRCAPGGLAYERASDPWVSIGPDGTAYAVGLSLDSGAGPTAIVASTSRDGGRTWARPRIVQADPVNSPFFNDKESVTADPTRPGTAYVVWDRSRPAPGQHFRIPAMFSVTTDGGSTWSTPRAIAAKALDQQSIGNVIVADPRSHKLYEFYTLFFCTCPTVARIQFVESNDGGSTWSRPHDVDNLDAIPVTDPNTGELLRTNDFSPSVALDPSNGSLHVAWQSPRFNGGHYDEVAVTTSTDGGRTWSAAVRGNSFTGRPAFTPTLAVSSDGTLGLTYYDMRALAPGNTATLPTDYWFRDSRDEGRTFSADQHVAGPFDMKAAPVSAGRGFFVGDYEGLTAVGRHFVPFFVRTNCLAGPCRRDRTDVYAAQVTPLPAGAEHASEGPPAVAMAAPATRAGTWPRSP